MIAEQSLLHERECVSASVVPTLTFFLKKAKEVGNYRVNFSSQEIEFIERKEKIEIDSILGFADFEDVALCDNLAFPPSLPPLTDNFEVDNLAHSLLEAIIHLRADFIFREVSKMI